MLKYRRWIQILALIVFSFLIVKGKVQIWMVIFLGSLLLSTFLGRFYCGYICPINTVMEVIDDDASKKKRKRIKTPTWISHNTIRVGVLILFLGTMIFVFKTGKRLPVLPILFALGVLLTIFFEPSLWHRYLCPYGTLFSVFSSKSKNGYKVGTEGCIRCGMCVKSCPADAIAWDDKERDPVINKKECIVCGRCAKVCPKKVIDYK
ncbi:4Fe-4S binding protein [Tissierella sp.]|uniref:4Fe-4S binding protein n=1 Tax=Tissierella sp. TaxID=41274 RepID=UPI002857770A|nr:4Fe-4S binding protein [Tissierella sp.]MDR7857035.1 4Fe-4S binding protein [Tissierella sp.]